MDIATATTTTLDWNGLLREQFEWHWTQGLRPRLAGMSDDEYLWEPVPGAWSVRRRGDGSAPLQVGAGEHAIDFAMPEPDPPPVTTIAWRLGHVVVGVLAMRTAAHFGGPAADYDTWEYAGTAGRALTQLDEQVDAWLAGVDSWGDDGLLQPCGDAEPFPDAPRAALVLHIHRELIHHLSEVCLLRDLYRDDPRTDRGDQ